MNEQGNSFNISKIQLEKNDGIEMIQSQSQVIGGPITTMSWTKQRFIKQMALR